MSDHSDTPVDPRSGLWIGAEDPGHSDCAFNLYVLDGEADLDAMRAAVGDAVRDDPVLGARIVDVGGVLRRRLVWRPSTESVPVEVVDLRSESPTDDRGEWVIDHVYDRGRRPRDLFTEPPARFVIVRLPRGRTGLGVELHHAAVDGNRAYGVVRSILAHYHRRVTGERPSWADVADIHSSVGAHTPVPPASRRTYLEYTRRLRRLYPVDDTMKIVGTKGGEPAQLAAHVVLTRDESTALRAAARGSGATLTDLVVAATMSAVGDRASDRGREVGVQRYMIPVNQRLRAPGSSRNEVAEIVVGASPGDVADQAGLLRSVAEQRKRALDLGIDVRLGLMVSRVGAVLELRLVRRILLQPLARRLARGWTLFVTNPGIVWPRTDGGRPDGALAIDSAGGLRPVDLISCFNAGGVDSAILSMLTFDGRLILTLVSNAATMTEAELRALTSAIGRRVRSFI